MLWGRWWLNWRDLWFHTGDLLRRDAQGYYYFIDRLKDTIRVGGENVSSHEPETEAISHPAVKEAAAVGVPARWGEHEIKLFIVLEGGPAGAAHARIVLAFKLNCRTDGIRGH